MNMSEKYNIEELIVRFLQQEINEDELRYLEAWLEEDLEHKSYFFGLKRISDSSHHSFFSREEVKEESWQRMHARIQGVAKEDLPSGKPRMRGLWISWMKYAAIVVSAVGLGWSIHEYQEKGNPVYPMEEKVVYNEVHVQEGGRANTLVLADGTKVVLNAASTFKYPSNFNAKNRQVYLTGEAYFEVTRNEEKPFVVKLKSQDVTVLGTTFNVQAYEDESYSVVTLLSGKVMLDAFNELGESTGRLFLKPNQQVVSDNKTGATSLLDVDASLANAWINGEYKFKDESLSAIVNRLEKYYNVRIHLDDLYLKEIRYTGTFSLDQDILDVFRIIDYEKRFLIKRAGKEIFITSKK